MRNSTVFPHKTIASSKAIQCPRPIRSSLFLIGSEEGLMLMRVMKNLRRRTNISGQKLISRLITTEFRGNRELYDHFDEFLSQKTYSHDFCLRLLDLARRSSGIAWEIKRLAVLMLEHQVLKLDPGNLDEFAFLLTELNLKRGPGLDRPLESQLLKEGYSTTDLRRFIPEFLRRLGRLNHVHVKINGLKTSDVALRDFIELSRSDCKLSLARYLFAPEEVANQILRQIQVSDGMDDRDTTQPPFLAGEVAQSFTRLPDFEANILKRLCKDANVYWVSETTSSEINSLVEYPLTTVVLVIKPPGSDIEFEIKRAGRKSRNSLNVVYARNGYTVPPSHRLDGGSMQWLLRYESNAASRLSLIYRLVHGTDAPIASYISRSNIYSVPVQGASVQTLPYFTEAQSFGKGFREMRTAMQESVSAFVEEGATSLPALPGDLGLTAQFISQVAPAQAILCGTSSFRLDKIASYLSPNGPQRYFEGLAVAYKKRDARRFADAILEETLGSYQPPDVRYQSHEQYLAAAFSVPGNRSSANRVYLSLIQQIARFWGTLLAVRAYSRGESFVARNVGLKSYWASGAWNVKIIFMDHDAVVMPGPRDKNFLARNALPEMKLDERYIWGGSNPAQFATSEVGYLQNIYRVGARLRKNGQELAYQILRDSYKKTQYEALTNPKLRRLFNEVFITRLPDWDKFVTGYLQLNGDKLATAAWKKKMKRTLAAKGYRQEAFKAYADSIETNREFLERYVKLFDLETREQM